METLFIFLVKSSGLIGMFYLAYYFLLRKETFFNSNRWFLLAGLITSVILPLVVFTKIVWVEPSPNNFDWSKIPVTTPIENDAFEINWFLVFAIIYSIGILGFLFKFAFDFYSLSKVLKGKTIQKHADFKFIDVSENIAPFSYFNSIIYNSLLYSDTELENILEHEKIHSSQNHTLDVLISRLFCVFFWFNPLVWLYKKAIVQNLEFIADSEASKNLSDKKAYQLTLLKITTQENCVAITNHFYQSLIKKRIVMLNKNQSNKRDSWKYAAVLPLLGAFLFFFQVKVVAQEKAVPKLENETRTEAIDLTKSKVNKDLITLSKGKEIYINGEKSSQEELAKLDPNEIEKIDVAKVNNKEAILITPKRLIKPVRITDKDIYIDGVKSTNEEFNKLDQSTVDKVDVNTFENTIRITTKSEKPIIIVDGIQKEASFKIDDIPTDQIASVNVLKGKAAEEKYGSDGKYGVIEIFTKNPTFSMSKTENINEKRLIIINGEKTKATLEDLKKLDPNLIQSMNIFKGKSATEKYGKEGKNGAIEIITKENADILKSSTTKTKNEDSQDKSEIENTGNEIVSSKEQWLDTYKAIWKARFSLEKIKTQKEQAKIELEKARVSLKSKLFS